jgi:hypothetical protein
MGSLRKSEDFCHSPHNTNCLEAASEHLTERLLPDASASDRLLWTQSQLAQIMFVEFAVGFSRLVQRKCARDVDFKGTGFNQTV